MESKKPDRLIRFADMASMVGLRRTTIYRLIREGSFPKPIPLTDVVGVKRAPMGWLESEVSAWIADRVAMAKRAATGEGSR